MASIIEGYKYKGGFWFRLFGVGLNFRNVKLHPPLFSERCGYTRVLKLGWLRVTYLRKMPASAEIAGE